MDLFSLFLFTHENNEIKSPTKIYDFTVNCFQNKYYCQGQNVINSRLSWIYLKFLSLQVQFIVLSFSCKKF